MLGVPAAKLSTQQVEYPVNTQLRIAFDLDAVLFSDESEKIFKSKGLDAFLNHEIEKKNVPLKEVSVPLLHVPRSLESMHSNEILVMRATPFSYYQLSRKL